MGWQQGDLDAINDAIASGAREVQYSDKKIVYDNLADKLRAKRLIEAELQGQKRVKHKYGVYFKR